MSTDSSSPASSNPAHTDVELTAVRDTFDEAALHAYLREAVDGYEGELTVRQFEGGQSNPTFQLSAGDTRYVLRKQPSGELLPSAHQVDREYRVMQALYPTAVPVPKMHCLCEDPKVIGTKFYVMEMVEGRLLTETTMPSETPADRRSVYLDLARALAELHKVDPVAAGLESFGRPGNYYERQIGRWIKQYQASKTEQIDAMDTLMAWLPDNIPAAGDAVIVHGDYRLGNTLLAPDAPRIVAVLDWELSTLGDGLADLGYLCQDYHGYSYEDEGLVGADLEALGIPTEQELVAEYCKHAGRPAIDNWTFYIVYNMFRSAAIIQGVYKRGLDGNASSAKALEYADAARTRSEQALVVLEANG